MLARDKQRKLAQVLAGALAAVLVAGFLTWKFQLPLQNALYRFRNVQTLTADQERSLTPHQTFKECTNCPEMLVVQAGTFKMGSPDVEHHKEEYPPHDVTIAQVAISRFELTFDAWDACAANGECRSDISADWGRGQQPVINVTWQDAKQYVEWLSSVTGKPYRLLSEAEWEYAAGAGKTTLYFFGNDDAMLDQYSWYGVNAQSHAHPVGSGKNPIRSGCRICTAMSPSGSRTATTKAIAAHPPTARPGRRAIAHTVSFVAAIGCHGRRSCARQAATGRISIRAPTPPDCGLRARCHADAKA